MDFLKYAVIGLAAAVGLTGCQFSYYLHGAYHQSVIYGSRKSITRTLRGDSVSDENKRKLRLVLDAKKFGEDTLGLKTKNNYNTYVDINRPYITYVVQAASAWELKPYLWHFPIVGDVPYKGYFSKALADDEARSFDQNQYDTYVRGVSAFSSLGWLDDPVLSSMLRYEDHDLVELILHESVHATLFVSGAADFNERMATYLGHEGMRRYYLQIEGSDSATLKKSAADSHNQKLFSAFLTKELDELKNWYQVQTNPISPESKKERLKQIQERFSKQVRPKLIGPSYKEFENQELNNAILLAYKTYEYSLEDFEKLFEKVEGDYSRALEYLMSLKKSKHPDQDLKRYVNENSTASNSQPSE